MGIKCLTQLVLVVDGLAYALQVFGIRRLRNPQADVPCAPVLFLHVLAKALPLLFLIEFGIVFQAKLYGAAKHAARLKNAVGLGYDFPIEATRRSAGRGAMILHSFFHKPNLSWREPLAQTRVGGKNLPTRDMMYGAWPLHAQVMISRYGVDHVDVCARETSQLQRVLDDALRVLQSVTVSEIVVAWQYVAFDEGHQLQIDVLKHIRYAKNRMANADMTPKTRMLRAVMPST